MAQKHEKLLAQFPEYRAQILALSASDRNFDQLAVEYEQLREEIHRLEASGDAGPDYTNLCDRRDRLQEALVIMMQDAEGR